MSYYESFETNPAFGKYEMIVVTDCGEQATNGIYFECAAPNYENTTNRHIRKPNSKSSTFFVFNDKHTILYKESPIISYRSRVEKFDEDLDYSIDIYEEDEEDDDVLIEINKLTKQELDFFVEYYASINEFTPQKWLTNARFKQLRAYINEYNKYQTVLYKLNQDITPNKWECIDGKEPAPMVTLVDNKDIEYKEKDYIPQILNENTVRFKYEAIYEAFFDELYKLLNEILNDIEYNIFESKLIFNIIKEYLFCYHQNCGMMRCYTRGRWHSPFQSQWILFFCNICTKKWAHYIIAPWGARFEIFPSELISSVKFKYNGEVNGYKMKETGDSVKRDDLGSFNSSNQNVEPFPMLLKDDHW